MASKIRPWTDDDVEALKAAYRDATLNPEIRLDRLAEKFGRDKANVCRKARELGLTDIRRKRVRVLKSEPKYGHRGSKELSEQISRWVKKSQKENGHPRGALGMKHTEENTRKMKEATRKAWADPNSKFNSPENRQRLSDNMMKRVLSGQARNGYTRCAGGRRADLGDIYFRSSWEANYARFLNWLIRNKEIVKWEYEVHTFVFESIKRGTRAYTPDFKVTYPSGKHEWHEVKGWMDPKSITRLKRMEKYFPSEKMVVIDEKWFRAVKRQGIEALIPGWESRGRGNRDC